MILGWQLHKLRQQRVHRQPKTSRSVGPTNQVVLSTCRRGVSMYQNALVRQSQVLKHRQKPSVQETESALLGMHFLQTAEQLQTLLSVDCAHSCCFPCSPIWQCPETVRCGMLCCAMLCWLGYPQAQVDALVSENEALHDQLAKAATRLAHAAAANRATAAATTDADKPRLQVRHVTDWMRRCAVLCCAELFV